MAHTYGRKPTARQVAEAAAAKLLVKAAEAENRDLRDGYRDRARALIDGAKTPRELALEIGTLHEKAAEARRTGDHELARAHEGRIADLAALMPPPGPATEGDLLDRDEYAAKAAAAEDPTLRQGYRDMAREITRRARGY